MNLEDRIVEIEEWDAVHVTPGTSRGRTGGLEMIVIGAPNLGEWPRGDVEGRRDWWVTSAGQVGLRVGPKD